MGGIADLPVPAGGAVASLPVPGQTVEPQQADVQAFQATAGPFRRGFRSGMNSVGGMLNNLIGQSAESLGLHDFAESRFQEAKRYADFADAVGPDVKDLGQVQDFDSLLNFVTGQAASGAATSLPVIAASVGLRRPVLGVLGGTAALETGEQIGNLRDDPNVARKDILPNALAKGGINALLEVAGGAELRAAKALTKPARATIGKVAAETAKGTVGEGLTEGAQEYVGQKLHQQLNPQVKIDPQQIATAAAAGAAGGGLLTGAASAAGNAASLLAGTPEELRQRLARRKPPLNPEGTPDNITKEDDVQTVAEKLRQHEDEALKSYGTEDFDQAIQKFSEADKAYTDEVRKPMVEQAVEAAKGLISKAEDKRVEDAGVKFNLMEKRDVLKELGTQVLTGKKIYAPETNREVADFLAKNGYKQDRPGVWVPAAKYTEMRGTIDQEIHKFMVKRLSEDTKKGAAEGHLLALSKAIREVAQNPETLQDSPMVRAFAKAIGEDAFKDTLDFAMEQIHGKGPALAVAKRIVTERYFAPRLRTDEMRLRDVQDVLRTFAQTRYQEDAGQMDVLTEEFAPRLVEWLGTKTGGAKVDKQMTELLGHVFGEKQDQALGLLELAGTRSKETHVAEMADAAQAKEGSPFKDPRLGVPLTADRAQKVLEDLNKEYGHRDVRFQSIPLEQPGMYSLEAHEADRSELSEDAWTRIRETQGHHADRPFYYKGRPLLPGQITVKAWSRNKLSGGLTQSENKINLVNLTGEMMSTEKQQKQQGGARYVADMFARGISALTSAEINTGKVDAEGNAIFEPRFRGFKERDLDALPPNTVVAWLRGRPYTLEDVRTAGYGRHPQAVALRRAIREASTDKERAAAVHALGAFYNAEGGFNNALETLVDDAMEYIDDNGADSVEEALAPLRAAEENAASKLPPPARLKRNQRPPEPTPEERTAKDHLDQIRRAIDRVEQHAEQERQPAPSPDSDENNPFRGETMAEERAKGSGPRTYEEDTGASVTQTTRAQRAAAAEGRNRGSTDEETKNKSGPVTTQKNVPAPASAQLPEDNLLSPQFTEGEAKRQEALPEPLGGPFRGDAAKAPNKEGPVGGQELGVLKTREQGVKTPEESHARTEKLHAEVSAAAAQRAEELKVSDKLAIDKLEDVQKRLENKDDIFSEVISNIGRTLKRAAEAGAAAVADYASNYTYLNRDLDEQDVREFPTAQAEITKMLNQASLPDDLSKKFRTVLSEWQKTFKMPGNILFVSDEDLRFLRENTQDMSREAKRVVNRLMLDNLANEAHGATIQIDKSNGIIWLSDRTMSNPVQAVSVLAHEFAHVFDYRYLINKASPEIRQALAIRFTHYLQGLRQLETRASSEEDDINMTARYRLAMRKPHTAPLTLQGTENLLKRPINGWERMFQEWFAEQAAKYMMQDRRTLAPVERFFHDFGQMVREYLTRVRNLVASVMGEEWVNSLKTKPSAPDEIVKAFLDAHLAGRDPTEGMIRWSREIGLERLIPVNQLYSTRMNENQKVYSVADNLADGIRHPAYGPTSATADAKLAHETLSVVEAMLHKAKLPNLSPEAQYKNAVDFTKHEAKVTQSPEMKAKYMRALDVLIKGAKGVEELKAQANPVRMSERFDAPRMGDLMQPLDERKLKLTPQEKADPLVKEFIRLQDRVMRAEFDRTYHDYSAAEQEALDFGDSAKFSQLAGYTPQEYKEFSRVNELVGVLDKKYGEDFSINLSYGIQQASETPASLARAKKQRAAFEAKEAELQKGSGKFKFNSMNVGRGARLTAAQEAEVRAYVEKVLGASAKVKFAEFEKMGAFAKLSGVETLLIANDSQVPLTIAKHEAAHALMSRLLAADPKARNVLLRAAGAPAIVARLNELLKDHPEALKQLADPEERVAYMYQFWADGHSGLLRVGPETKTWFERIKSFFKKVRAVWADDLNTELAIDRAGALLDAFHNGAFANPSTVGQVIRERFPLEARERMDKFFPAFGRFMDKFVFTSTGVVRDMNIQVLTDVMDKFHIPVEAEGKDPGFLQAKHVEYNRRINKVFAALEGMDKPQIDALVTELRSGPPRTAAGRTLRAVLDEALRYMIDAGVKVQVYDEQTKTYSYREIRPLENYFPRVGNREYLSTADGMAGFIALLTKYRVPNPDEVYENYVSGPAETNPRTDPVIGLTFYAPNINERTLAHIPDSELAPYLSNNIVEIMSHYLARAARRAEYTRRFDNAGERIRDAILAAREHGLTDDQERTFNEAVQALEGTLGANISDGMKKVFGGITTYQNIRLLPLAIFSSLVDPLGIVVRGGTVREAGAAFWRGIRNIVSESKDEAFDFARVVGAINSAHDMAMMQELYSSQFMPRTQQIINDAFFKYNGMEGWNRSMRTAAAAAAEQFIIRHATRPGQHSARFLRELNLTAGDVSVAGGKLVLTDQVRKAVNLWVDQAILRPNAAVRPIYMSDPHWVLVSHLKQYMYLFQKTLVARVHHELQHGNYSPAFALAGYVPGIIASDMLRVLLTPGGGDDKFRESWTTGDYLWSGVKRASLFGPAQMALDANQDLAYDKLGIESLAGPSAQQLMDFLRASARGTGVGEQMLRAIPGERLFRG